MSRLLSNPRFIAVSSKRSRCSKRLAAMKAAMKEMHLDSYEPSKSGCQAVHVLSFKLKIESLRREQCWGVFGQGNEVFLWTWSIGKVQVSIESLIIIWAFAFQELPGALKCSLLILQIYANLPCWEYNILWLRHIHNLYADCSAPTGASWLSEGVCVSALKCHLGPCRCLARGSSTIDSA